MERRQLILFSIIFLGVVSLLTVAYLVFFRTPYGVLYENIREGDAAQVVAELDKQGIAYRLEDGGHRVMVSEGDIGKARVLIAGSGVAMGGVVGFELFNESDMGLTEFAQKVNYQRALQGELARTIMAMDGVNFARVHLSLPERSLFRASQQGAKAAVTVETEPGPPLSPERVAGIQQLVSSSVPSLAAWQVAVLDGRGRLLSAMAAASAAPPGELSEKQALEEYYRARAQAAAERLIPGLPFRITVLAIPTGEPETRAGAEAAGAERGKADDAARDAPPGRTRDFSLRIAFRTEAPLNTEDTGLLRQAIADAVNLSPKQGDVLRFETGPLEEPGQPTAPAAANGAGETWQPAAGASPQGPRPSALGMLAAILRSRLLWFAAAVIGVLLLIALRRRSRMSRAEQQSFADMLSESIAMRERASDGV